MNRTKWSRTRAKDRPPSKSKRARYDHDNTIAAGIILASPEQHTAFQLDWAGEIGHATPHFLPEGNELFISINSTDGVRMSVISLESGERRVLHLAVGGRRATLLPSRYLIFAESSGLMAARFDPRTRQLAGAPVPVLDDVYPTQGNIGSGNFAVSDSGSLAYVSGRAPQYRLVWADRQGRVPPSTESSDQYMHVALSPDGQRAAVILRRPPVDRGIWIYDMETTRRIRLTDVR